MSRRHDTRGDVLVTTSLFLLLSLSLLLLLSPKEAEAARGINSKLHQQLQHHDGAEDVRNLQEQIEYHLDYIRDFGYEAEYHTVETEDNYVLALLRIPSARGTQNVNKKVVILQHVSL